MGRGTKSRAITISLCGVYNGAVRNEKLLSLLFSVGEGGRGGHGQWLEMNGA